MSVIFWCLSSLLALWPYFAVVVIIVLTSMLFFRKDEKQSWAEGLPEIKAGWFMGNNDYSGDFFNAAFEKHYKAFKGLRYGLWNNGWGEKRLFVLDPDLVNQIFVTDFDHFEDNLALPDYYTKTMGNVFGIVDARGDKWRRMRKAVNPSFSLPKIKKYLSQYTKTCKEMVEFVETQAADSKVVECKDFVQRVAISTLACVGFGLEVNAFKEKEPEFMKQGNSMGAMWRWVMLLCAPRVAAFFRIGVYNKKAEAFFVSVVHKAIQERKKEGDTGKDVLGSLIHLHETNPDMTTEVLNKSVAQFVFDGYLTTADSMVGFLAVIATRPELQEKLREEIDAVFDRKEDGDIDLTADDVVGMDYLDNVILEFGRLFAIGMTTRLTTKTYKIPESELTLPVGAVVVLPISALQQDSDFWENPDEFIPERFNTENKGKIKTGTYQPFGLGPRQCLGYIYARFEMKMMIIYLLRFFDIENCEGLPKNFKRDKEQLFSPQGGLRVKFHKREM